MNIRTHKFGNYAVYAGAGGGGGGGYTGPGDVYGAALAWYGLRGFSGSYASPGTNPCVDLVDQAGANVATFNILSTGALDVASIAAWKTAHSVTTIMVTKIYDQSGNGNHAVQATLADMPVLSLASLGSLPTMVMTKSPTTYLEGPTSLSGHAQPLTFSAAANFNYTGFSAIFGGSGASGLGIWASSGTWSIYDGAQINVSAANGSYHAAQGLASGASSKLSVDGTSNTGTLGTSTYMAQPEVGSAFGSSYTWTGNFLEAGIWAGDKSSSWPTMNGNQHTYWGF